MDFEHNNDDKILILTATVNVHKDIAKLCQISPVKRIDAYTKAIKLWLDNTNFYIVVVDNSGYSFQDELKDYFIKYKHRFEVVYFDILLEPNKPNNKLNTKYLRKLKWHKKSKGMLELYSINYAYENSKLIKDNNFDFFIKITARYYTKEFESIMSNFDTKRYNSIRQLKCIFNRCELVGCNKKYFPILFDLNIDKIELPHVMYVEFIYHYRHRTKIPKNTVYMLDKLKLPWNTQRGGSKHGYEYL